MRQLIIFQIYIKILDHRLTIKKFVNIYTGLYEKWYDNDQLYINYTIKNGKKMVYVNHGMKMAHKRKYVYTKMECWMENINPGITMVYKRKCVYIKMEC